MFCNILLKNTKLKFLAPINFVIVLLFFSSCNSQKKLQGIYRSNSIVLGFFTTTVELKDYNTFNYEFSGDLQHTELTGVYEVKGNDLYLRFNKNKGEVESENDSLAITDILSGNYHNYDLKTDNNINYHLKYKIKGNKLFSYRINNTGLVKKAKVYGTQKKFLFFGTRWKNKRSYLKKN